MLSAAADGKPGGPQVTSGGLSGAGHEILRGHLPAGLGLDALDGGPGRTHGTAAPLGDGNRMNTQALSELRAGEFLAGKKGA